jgi:uncharacterized protein YndB with AHSA1/START domain
VTATREPDVSRKVGAMTMTLKSNLEIEFSRVFDAPRRLVFEAHARAEHVRRWWGPHGSTMTECELDFRPGGYWRFVIRTRDGKQVAFFGEYREIQAPERFVWTFAFDGLPPAEAGLETYTFSEADGKTTLVAVGHFTSIESRDAALATGMEKGAAETWDRLADLLPTLLPTPS